jgi:hypothetical protein|tara:strand:- start:568 stop:882 length:315 start_codon:yes stop_codon:yes gene_type:complete
MANAAWLTGTGTVHIDGVANGKLKGEIKTGATRLHSVTLMASSGTGTAIVFNGGDDSTGTAAVGTFTVATGSSRTIPFDGAMFTDGIRVAISGTLYGVLVTYGG